MKYQAKPVIVDAQVIIGIDTTSVEVDGTMLVYLDDAGGLNGGKFRLDKGMIARYVPKAGDYIVRQEDGYIYVNPKDVFERKYGPVELNALAGE